MSEMSSIKLLKLAYGKEGGEGQQGQGEVCRKAEWGSRAFSLMQLATSGEISGTKIARRTRSILYQASGVQRWILYYRWEWESLHKEHI